MPRLLVARLSSHSDARCRKILACPGARVIELTVFLTCMTHSVMASELDLSTTNPAKQEKRQLESNTVARSVDLAPKVVNREATPAKSLDLSEHVIRHAIADVKTTDDALGEAHAASFGSAGSARQEKIDQKFKQADIPTCMTMDAYKFDPPHIGPIPVPGFFAAPWLIHAIVTGKCRH
jgi:hypothetical protein